MEKIPSPVCRFFILPFETSNFLAKKKNLSSIARNLSILCTDFVSLWNTRYQWRNKQIQRRISATCVFTRANTTFKIGEHLWEIGSAPLSSNFYSLSGTDDKKTAQTESPRSFLSRYTCSFLPSPLHLLNFLVHHPTFVPSVGSSSPCFHSTIHPLSS